jgi:hypothetical protein
MQHDDIEALVNLAFPTPESANSRLTFEQFCEWCEATPGITDVRELFLDVYVKISMPAFSILISPVVQIVSS